MYANCIIVRIYTQSIIYNSSLLWQKMKTNERTKDYPKRDDSSKTGSQYKEEKRKGSNSLLNIKQTEEWLSQITGELWCIDLWQTDKTYVPAESWNLISNRALVHIDPWRKRPMYQLNQAISYLSLRPIWKWRSLWGKHLPIENLLK